MRSVYHRIYNGCVNKDWHLQLNLENIMSTPSTSIQANTIDKKITLFSPVRIDDLFIGVEKDESSGCTCYYITVSPNQHGVSSGTVKSAGNAIGNDDDAVKFLERLQEFKNTLKLAGF